MLKAGFVATVSKKCALDGCEWDTIRVREIPSKFYIEKNIEKGEAMKRWIFIVFIAFTSSPHRLHHHRILSWQNPPFGAPTGISMMRLFLGVVLPHLPCKISRAKFWQFQWLSPRFSWTIGQFQAVSVNFNQFQSASVTFNKFQVIWLSQERRVFLYNLKVGENNTQLLWRWQWRAFIASEGACLTDLLVILTTAKPTRVLEGAALLCNVE